MNYTEEEKLMYEVMKSIYDSGIPVSFKGSMVLKAYLSENGLIEETRHTVDIDANWNSDLLPSADQMIESFQKALDRSKIGLIVNLYRMYGEGRSAGFELKSKETDEIVFTMDVDVNRPSVKTKIYEINEICFSGVTVTQMLADKIAVLSSKKIMRRIKDLVDLYYISKVSEMDPDEVLSALNKSGKVLGDFSIFLFDLDSLKHAYQKFRFTGDVNKPSFEEVYQAVKTFIGAILEKEISDEERKRDQM